MRANPLDNPALPWEFAKNLNNDVKINILHAGDGTLWTDMERARMGDVGGATLIKQPEKK